MISIGNHEKGMKMHFPAPHNEMKCILCIKDSYTKGKKVKNFTFAYGQAGSDDPPPLTVTLPVKYLLFYGFPKPTVSLFLSLYVCLHLSLYLSLNLFLYVSLL